MRRYLENAGDSTRRRFQRLFLIGSGLIFWWLMRTNLAVREVHQHYQLLGLFLPFIFLLTIGLTPRKARLFLVFGTSGLFKFAVAINIFNVCLAVKLLIGRFESEAHVMAILLGTLFAATILLKLFVRPAWYYLVCLFCFDGVEGGTHNPQSDQGHRVREDFR